MSLSSSVNVDARCDVHELFTTGSTSSVNSVLLFVSLFVFRLNRFDIKQMQRAKHSERTRSVDFVFALYKSALLYSKKDRF